MSDLDLHERLRQESRALEAPSFTLDGVQQVGRSRRRRKAAAMGAGLASVLVLAVLAVAALPDGDPPPAADAPAFVWDLGVAPTGTVDPEVVRDAVAASPLVGEARLAPYDLVQRGSEIAAPPLAEPDSGAGFRVIVVALAAGADPDVAERELALVDGVAEVWPSPRVAHPRLERFFAGLRPGATVVYSDDVEILQPPPGPEPAFDPAGLGDPAPLLPMGAAGELTADDLTALRRPGDASMGPDPRHPFVYVGALENGHQLVVYGNAQGNLCEAFFVDRALGSTGCDRMFADPSYGLRGSSTHSGPGAPGGTMSAFVPADASVVVATVAGATMWQRPVAGFAYFPVQEAAGPVEIVALAANGTELGRWADSLG